MEIYFLNNKKELISSINTIDSINDALILFESKTGLSIDKYGGTKLYYNHVKLLYGLIEKNNEWKITLKKAYEKATGILIIGIKLYSTIINPSFNSSVPKSSIFSAN